jgi:hypothetical protein
LTTRGDWCTQRRCASTSPRGKEGAQRKRKEKDALGKETPQKVKKKVKKNSER